VVYWLSTMQNQLKMTRENECASKNAIGESQNITTI